MEGFKEFQGRDLDDAISRACAYFDVPREKLELDIVRDSKSGIFGIVGARKAVVRARRVPVRGASLPDLKEESPDEAPDEAAEERKARPLREAAPKSAPKKPAKAPAPAPAKKPAPPVIDEEDEEGESQTLFLNKLPPAPVYEDMHIELGTPDEPPRRPFPGRGNRNGNGASARKKPAPLPASDQTLFTGKDLDEDAGHEGLPELPLEELDGERLKSVCLETVQRLVEPVVGPTACELRLEDGRVHVRVDCGENSGVLIGREGQTLAALQYLASRIVSRAMNAAVRVNLDAGEYRQRQDDKLRTLALSLAARVKKTGKAFSTRPLSSYHRRIIHLTLQEDPDVQTRSMGEGNLKRVIVQRRR